MAWTEERAAAIRQRMHHIDEPWTDDEEDLLALLAEVERLTGLVATATVEAAKAQKENARLRADVVEKLDTHSKLDAINHTLSVLVVRQGGTDETLRAIEALLARTEVS